jgi:two-component system sensor histidine kinase QseC
MVWLGLMVFELERTRLTESRNPFLQQIAAGLQQGLTGIEEPQFAARFVQTIDRMAKAQRALLNPKIALIIQVRDRSDGQIVFRSLPDLQFDPLPAGYSQLSIGGTSYYVYCEQDERWRIAVAQARLPTFWVLEQLSDQMTTDILIAWPLVLVPVWLAVRLGLRPLHNLANSINTRGPDDLSPVQVTRQHAEVTLLAKAFNLQLARVAQLIARERAFVQDAAHELRTPMAGVAVNAYALANAPTAEERAAAETRLHSGLSRTSHLVVQLLALTRLDGTRPSDVTLQDVVSLVRDELAGVAPWALASNIELALEAPDALSRLVEIHALRSIVGNLVDNAIRYGRKGGRIVVTLAATGAGWSLNVADDGIGIPEAERARVFERFYRGDHEDLPGTGLGLAIVRAAAAQLGGTVRITDGLDGRGCTFVVQFAADPTRGPQY